MDHQDYIIITPDRERGQHLTFEDRCTIKILRKQGQSYRAIAAQVNCSPSTIGYELRRGTPTKTSNLGRPTAYSAKRGEAVYHENRKNCHKPHKLTKTNPFGIWVSEQVKSSKKWSLDACAGYAKRNNLFPTDQLVSTKTLYNGVRSGRIGLNLFDLPEVLLRKKHHKRTRQNKRLMGTSIEERPKIVSEKVEIGHWEIDTVIGHRAGKEAAVLTIVEKMTLNYLALKINGKDSSSVMAAMKTLRFEYGDRFNEVFKSITSDNGTEFERLSEIEDWGSKVYFAHPYSSWERPQNERHNRIFRRYVPKGTSIENYSAEQIVGFADAMNNLPRKVLGYSCPEELFEAHLDKIYSTRDIVA